MYLIRLRLLKTTDYRRQIRALHHVSFTALVLSLTNMTRVWGRPSTNAMYVYMYSLFILIVFIYLSRSNFKIVYIYNVIANQNRLTGTTQIINTWNGNKMFLTYRISKN